MEDIWDHMYREAKQVLNSRNISQWMEAGGVAAAIETVDGSIYTGVCVDTACTLGICAERNAIFSMITAGEQEISRVIAIGGDGSTVPPCGACREFMSQLMPEKFRGIEIMMDYGADRVVTLGELTPDWWIK